MIGNPIYGLVHFPLCSPVGDTPLINNPSNPFLTLDLITRAVVTKLCIDSLYHHHHIGDTTDMINQGDRP